MTFVLRATSNYYILFSFALVIIAEKQISLFLRGTADCKLRSYFDI